MQDAVRKLNRIVVEIRIKANFEDGCGPNKGTRCRGDKE